MDFNFRLTGTNKTNTSDVVIIGGGRQVTAAMYAARRSAHRGHRQGADGRRWALPARSPTSQASSARLAARSRSSACAMQAESFGARFIQDKVQAVDLASEPKLVFGNAGTYWRAPSSLRRVPWDAASASRARTNCWAVASPLRNVRCRVLSGQTVAVAGNSDEAIEEALFLTRFAGHCAPAFADARTQGAGPSRRGDRREPKGHDSPRRAVREVVGNGRVEGCAVAQRGINGRDATARDRCVSLLRARRPAITDFVRDRNQVSERLPGRRQASTALRLAGVYAVGDVSQPHQTGRHRRGGRKRLRPLAVDPNLA